MKTVLFVCIQNAGRSQMAEACFNQLAKGKARAFSAGSHPAARVHLAVVEVMRESGIDLGAKIPQKLTPELITQADFIVTMGCGDACPVTGPHTIEWHIEDPSEKPLNELRLIRDKIKGKAADLITDLKL